MLEKLRKALDNGQFTGILLTDLSKAFDCLQHDLLIAKLDAYGISKKALKLLWSYLTGRKHRTKINQSFSAWAEILFGVPQGSILGPLLFIIYINDLFMFTEDFDVANYADDCSAYEYKKTLSEVITCLERDAACLLEWYQNNYLTPNPDKHHLLLNIVEGDWSLRIASETIKNSKEEKVLGITFDNKLSFESHVTKICNTASQKLHALARISNLMSMEKRKILMNAFINSQFGYCPLIWMCHSCKLNNRINYIHERALRIVFQDKKSSFEELLKKAKSVKVHEKNLQVLATEMYKNYHNLSPLIMSDIFPRRTIQYNLRGNQDFSTRNVHSVRYGTDSLSYLGPKICELIPNDIKESKTIKCF